MGRRLAAKGANRKDAKTRWIEKANSRMRGNSTSSPSTLPKRHPQWKAEKTLTTVPEVFADHDVRRNSSNLTLLHEAEELADRFRKQTDRRRAERLKCFPKSLGSLSCPT
jgi:hypothetical protein